MDKKQKTLKSPLSAKLAEIKAKAAGEAQKSLAREVLSRIVFITLDIKKLERKVFSLRKLLVELLK